MQPYIMVLRGKKESTIGLRIELTCCSTDVCDESIECFRFAASFTRRREVEELKVEPN